MQMPAIDQKELEIFRSLFREYAQEFVPTKEGQELISARPSDREVGRQNYLNIKNAVNSGQDVTDSALLKILPYADSEIHRKQNAWIHIAPVIQGDVKVWFDRNGWKKPEEWPGTVRAILQFLDQVEQDPEQLEKACMEFGQSQYSKGLQSAMLSPILNALQPNHCLLINAVSARGLEYFTGNKLSTKIEEYPTSNRFAWDVVNAAKPFIEELGLSEAPGDLVDAFYYWVSAVRKPPLRKVDYWKIAPGAQADHWDICLEGNFIAVGWKDTGDLTGMSRNQFKEMVKQLDAKEGGWDRPGTDQLWKFYKIQEGDRIVVNRGTTEVLGIGTVNGPYYYVDGESTDDTEFYSHRLPVTWDDLTIRTVNKPGWRKAIIKLSEDDFHEIEGAPSKKGEVVLPKVGTNPIYSLAQCAKETGFAEELLDRWITAIHRKGQAIIYGPPGTGKTYLARALAQHIVGGTNGVTDLIQFHPAYAYEDFILGIRPRTRTDGGLEYRLEPGRFLEFCTEAEQRQGESVLILDEINRANLARVMGELMYLLEYRNEKVRLAGGREFQIPDKVRIIGTMNTADRSIALVDHALRRRFAFLALYPDYDLLRRFHDGKSEINLDGLIEVLMQINQQIGDEQYQVGPSFFLRKNLSDELEDIWRMEIEPYLGEYFFDQQGKAKAFSWSQIKHKVEL
jgi:hypothetical protein